MIAYTDGSDDPTVDTPSGAAITFNTTPPTTICNTSPIKGCYPAEAYAIILCTYLPHINTFSQPIIFAIDNPLGLLHTPPNTTIKSYTLRFKR